MPLHRSGERAPATLYRDVLSGREVVLARAGLLPPGPRGAKTLYVSLTAPHWLRLRKEALMIENESKGAAGTAAAVTAAGAKPDKPHTFDNGLRTTLRGACGRTLLLSGEDGDSLTLALEPPVNRQATDTPCRRCRRNCPGTPDAAAREHAPNPGAGG